MGKSVQNFLMFLFFCSCSGQSPLIDSKDHYVILMGGQSNMVGQGKMADLGEVEIPDNIEFIETVKGPVSFHEKKSFGPEIGLWNTLSEEFPDNHFTLVKYAIGGSSMLDCSADYDKERAGITGHPEYGNMLGKFVEKIKRSVGDSEVKFVALLWMQGERDAKVPEAADQYFQNFNEFISALRSRISAEDLPVVYGLVNPDPNKYPALDVVQAAQRKVDELRNETYLIETGDLEKWDDNVHYSTNGQLILGRKFADVVVDLIKKEKNEKGN